MASESYVDQQEAVVRELKGCCDCNALVLCTRHSTYFLQRPYIYPESGTAQEEWCESEEQVAFKEADWGLAFCDVVARWAHMVASMSYARHGRTFFARDFTEV